MGKFSLRKLNKKVNNLEYEMYQEIPASENGAINKLNNLDLEKFKEAVLRKIGEEQNELTDDDLPRITYILYDNDYPVGEINIRPVLNEKWFYLSGNIGYKIRPTERNKGYGNIILKLGLKKCKQLGLSKVYLLCYKNNDYSRKIIEKNKGIILLEEQDVFYYTIAL